MMRAVRWLLVAWAALIAVGVVYDATRRHAPPPSPPPQPSSPPQKSSPWTGTASCMGRSCHGGIVPRDGDILLNEASTIAALDPHAKAYETLRTQESQDMARRLGWTGKAEEMPRCLACHATPLGVGRPASAELAASDVRFGVGCESCHGPAVGWIDQHYRSDASSSPAARRSRATGLPGFVNLADTTTRAAVCAGCHVGSPDSPANGERNVDHDLIAAGHPRLLFEFVSLQDAMPVHWKPKPRDANFEWYVGQIEGARASLNVLSDRIDRGAVWPEFAEFDCFACHHDLQAQSWRQTIVRSRPAGSLPWNSWNTSVVTRLLENQGLPSKDWRDLAAAMENLASPPDKSQLGGLIKNAEARLNALSKNAVRWHGPLAPMKSFINDWKTVDSWEAAEQFYFALRAYHRVTDDPAIAAQFERLEPRRGLVAGYNSPRAFDPGIFQKNELTPKRQPNPK